MITRSLTEPFDSSCIFNVTTSSSHKHLGFGYFIFGCKLIRVKRYRDKKTQLAEGSPPDILDDVSLQRMLNYPLYKFIPTPLNFAMNALNLKFQIYDWSVISSPQKKQSNVETPAQSYVADPPLIEARLCDRDTSVKSKISN